MLLDMSGLDHIVTLATAYGSHEGVENSTVSWRVFGDSKKLDAIIGGADLQVTRYERALSWFSANWPEGLDWPLAVPRPSQEAAA